MLQHFGGSVLGIPWDTVKDEITMRPMVNLSQKQQKIRTGPAVTPENLHEIEDAKLTLRIVTSQIYGIYDPLGLLSPVTIKYKILLQQLSACGLEWDDPLPADLDARAREVLREIVLAGEVKFPRALMEEGADMYGT